MKIGRLFRCLVGVGGLAIVLGGCNADIFKGPAGLDGLDGANGQNGATWLSGTADPLPHWETQVTGTSISGQATPGYGAPAAG
jgi:hypothetical protein